MHAQTVLPGAVEAGRVAPQQPTLDVPIADPANMTPAVQPVPLSAPGTSEVSFVLEGVEMTESTIYDPAELAAPFAARISTSITLAELVEMINAITLRYRNDGYVLSRAFLPPQDIEYGIVQIALIEGRIERVLIEGDFADNRDVIAEMAENIARKPLKVQELEQTLLTINDLPGISAKGLLRPGAVPGSSDLVLVVDYDELNGNIAYNNHGSPYIGPHQFTASANFNNPSGRMDRGYLAIARTPTASELSYIQAGYEYVLTPKGDTILAEFTSSSSRAGRELESLGIDSTSANIKLEGDYKIKRSRTENMSTFAGFNYMDAEVDSISGRISQDKLRELYIGLRADKVDDWRGINIAEARITKGLGQLGATDDADPLKSREAGEAEYWKVNIEAARLQRLTESLQLLMAFSGQFADDSLLAPAEFGVGGAYFGRGYDPSELTGDHGAALKAELRLADPMSLPWLASKLDSWQVFGFLDLSSIRNKDADDEDKQPQTLVSGGFGARVQWEKLQGELVFAQPLSRNVDTQGNNDPSWLFNISTEF